MDALRPTPIDAVDVGAFANASVPLAFAAFFDRSDRSVPLGRGHFNGKIESPRLCANPLSGADVLGNPVPGTVIAGAQGAPTTTSTVPRTTTTTPGGAAPRATGTPWVAQVSQPGIAPRTVAVITLFA